MPAVVAPVPLGADDPAALAPEPGVDVVVEVGVELLAHEVVRFEEIRSYLEVVVEAAYQGCGYRRVKNPRIWSLHDIAALDRVLEIEPAWLLGITHHADRREAADP